MLPTLRTLLVQYGLATLAVLVALLIKGFWAAFWGTDTLFLLFFGPILLSAWYGGAGPGTATTLMIALVTNSGNLDPDNGVRLGLFLLEGILFSHLVAHQRQTETELRRTNELLQALISASPIAITVFDYDGIVKLWSPAAEQIFGWRADEVLGRPLPSIPPAKKDEFRTNLQRVFQGELLMGLEAVRAKKDGALFHANIWAAPIRADDGTARYCMSLVADITARKEVELERNQLLAAERAARAEAEVTQQRLAFLAQASALLNKSLDYATTLTNLAHMVVPWLADYCIIDMVGQDGQLHRVEVAHKNPQKEQVIRELQHRYPPHNQPLNSVTRVWRTGQPLFVSHITPEQLQSGAQDADHLRLLQELGPTSAMLLPMRASEQIVGVMSLVISSPDRHYNPADLALAEEVADRAALAVEHARLYHQAQTARAAAASAAQQAAFLSEASQVLTASLDYETTLKDLARLSVPAIADWCSVHILQEPETLRLIALVQTDTVTLGDDPILQHDIHLHPDLTHPIVRVLHNGRSELISREDPEAELGPAPGSDPATSLQLRVRSALLIPLMVPNRAIGVLCFATNPQGRKYTPDELALAEELARRAAIAIDNARLYREAQEAIAARDQFLSIASHELRTPITGLRGYAELLERRATHQDILAPRDLRAVKTIFQEANRLNKLIDLLLDLSRIQSGHLVIDQELVDLGALIRRLVEMVQPSLDRHEIMLDAPSEPLWVQGDELRLGQVFQNLIDNAIKYSPLSNTITILLKVQGEKVLCSVTDQGIGIPTEALTQLFTRFYRATNVTSHRIGGMGLGLYIVRHILEAHHGTISVQSAPGVGSTFTVSLPLAPAPHPVLFAKHEQE